MHCPRVPAGRYRTGNGYILGFSEVEVGRFASLMPGAQGLGQILGPNIAATILAAGLGYDGVFMMCAAAPLIAMSVYLFMYLRLKRTIPALADAS